MTDDRPRCEKTGKVPFAKRDALAKKNALINRGNEGYLRVYQCDGCNFWHLTKERRGEGRRK